MSHRYDRLVGMLHAPFKLDQPSLDFGFRSIMHLKGNKGTSFPKKDRSAR